MNREILFRGYNLKNKKWLYGYYFVNRGLHFITPDGMVNPLDTYENYMVDETSIGQYIGFKDGNGDKIFEGDILRYEHNAGDHIVKYSKESAAFVEIAKTPSGKPIEFFYISELWAYANRKKTIISNTYETPVNP